MTKVVKLSELEALYDSINEQCRQWDPYEAGLPLISVPDGQAILGMLAQFCVTHGLTVEDDTKSEAKEVILVVSSAQYGDEEFHYDSEEEAWAGMQRLMAEARKLKDGIKRMYYIKGEDDA